MKKFLCIGLCALSLFITGCTSTKNNPGKMEPVTVEQMQEKIENKESFAIVFTQPKCGYCNEFKAMLEEYLPTHDVTLLEVSIDISAMSKDEKTEMLAKINKYFPEMDGTPDLYYVKDGKIEDHFDSNEVYLGEEKNFSDWVEKYKLDANKN